MATILTAVSTHDLEGPRMTGTQSFKALFVDTLDTIVSGPQAWPLHQSPFSHDFLGRVVFRSLCIDTVFYAEVPAQFVSAVLVGFLPVGLKQVYSICTPNQPRHLHLSGKQSLLRVIIFWGIIGPSRQFGSGALYHPMLYTIIVNTSAFLVLRKVAPKLFSQRFRRHYSFLIRFLSLPYPESMLRRISWWGSYSSIF